MPRYYFDLKDGHRLVDPADVDCNGDDAAKEQAKIIARRIAADAPYAGPSPLGAILDRTEIYRLILRNSCPAMMGASRQASSRIHGTVVSRAWLQSAMLNIQRNVQHSDWLRNPAVPRGGSW